MVLRLRVEVARVENAEAGDLNVEHHGAQHVPGVVRGYGRVLERAHALPAADANDALHGIAYVLLHLGAGRAAPRLLLRNHLVVVLQQRGAKRLRGVAHVDGPGEATFLCQMQERADVIQVEVRHEHAVDAAAGAGAQAAEVREAPVV